MVVVVVAVVLLANVVVVVAGVAWLIKGAVASTVEALVLLTAAVVGALLVEPVGRCGTGSGSRRRRRCRCAGGTPAEGDVGVLVVVVVVVVAAAAGGVVVEDGGGNLVKVLGLAK